MRALAFAELYLNVDFHSWIMPDPKLDTDRLTGPFVNPNHLATFTALGGLAALGMFVETLRQAIVWDRGARIFARTAHTRLDRPGVGLADRHDRVALDLAAHPVARRRHRVLARHARAHHRARRRPPPERQAKRRDRRAMAAFLVAVVGIAAAISADPILGRVQYQGLEDTARASLARSTLNAAEAAPLLGHGFGAFQRYYPLFSDGSVPGDVDEAHNDVLETLADLGLLAGLAFIAAPALLAGMCLAGCLRRRRDRVFPAIGFAASIAVGAHAFVDFSLQIPAVAVTLRGRSGRRRRAILAHRQRSGPLSPVGLTPEVPRGFFPHPLIY